MLDEFEKSLGNLAERYVAYKNAEAKRDDAEEALSEAEIAMSEAWRACEEELGRVVKALPQ